MRKIVSVLSLCLIAIAFANAQNTTPSGVQILRSARSIYDQGRLHELPALLEQNMKAFTSTTEQVEAYRLLVLTYIYLEEPTKADENMIRLLNADKFFEPNPVDPVEFKTLYRKFRSKPIFRIGGKFGVNQSFANVKAIHSVQGGSIGYGKYTPNIGIIGIASFEKDLAGKFEKFSVNSEVMFNIRSLTYSNDRVYVLDPTPADGQEPEPASALHKITMTNMQVNALVNYNLGDNHKSLQEKFLPYVTLGVSVGYLMKSNFDGELTFENTQVSGSVDNTDSYNPINISIMGGGGFRYKIGGLYFIADARVAYGLGNVADENNRYRNTKEGSDLRHIYQYVDNDFSLNQVFISAGIMYPWFSPKKLIK